MQPPRPVAFVPSLLPSSLGICLGLLIGVLVAPHSKAQGFGVYEQGTCVMSRAGAAVAQGCGDGSSIFFNPANVLGTDGVTASIGATVIAAHGEFTYDYTTRPPYRGTEVELQNDPIPVPHAYLTFKLNEDLGFGLGFYVPYGLETNWPTVLSDGTIFDGAFEGYANRVQAVYLQPTAAYQITPRLRVGGGPILALSSVELNQVQDLSQTAIPDTDLTFAQIGVPFHTAFARSTLEASGELGFGANIGVTYEATDRLTVGARFTSPITVSYTGEATFAQLRTGLEIPVDLQGIEAGTSIDRLLRPQFGTGRPLSAQTVETELTFPLQIVGGVSVRATDRLRLMADYQFTGWSSFDEIPLEFERLPDRTREENYNDTHALRLGGEYDVLDQLTARAGYLYNTAAAPDAVVTPLLPEADRHQFTIGAGWRPAELLEVNVSYQLLRQNDRRGRVQGLPDDIPSGMSPTDYNQGVYSFGANLFGATLTFHL